MKDLIKKSYNINIYIYIIRFIKFYLWEGISNSVSSPSYVLSTLLFPGEHGFCGPPSKDFFVAFFGFPGFGLTQLVMSIWPRFIGKYVQS